MVSKTRKRCPKGKILRKGYTRKDGVRVRATCVKDRGEKGKGKQLFKNLEQGDLTKHGYSLKKSDLSRHRALNKARKEYSYAGLVHKLNALAILMKNTEPTYSKRAKKDMEWLKQTRKD